MLIHILKKDMMKRKGVNIILFLFITIATIFLASSVNNILVVSSAVDYYIDYANIPDVNVILNSEQDKDKIDVWLDKQKNGNKVLTSDYNQFIEISDKSVQIDRDGDKKDFDNKGATLFLSMMDTDYCQVFDLDGEEISLKDGEIALPLSAMERVDLEIGDQLNIQSYGIERTYTIQYTIKDAAFGNEMVGMNRFVISQNEFDIFAKTSPKLGLYYIMTDQIDILTKDLNNQGFQGIMNIISVDTYKMVYSFDMIMAGLLILIGICLILIALLVLRFTLVFSLEEQYQEIGILKAIGLRDLQIKKIYLIKYLVIVTIGAIIGTMASIPISQIMIQSVSKNMIMDNHDLNIGVNILCAIIVIILVLSFCYFCARKLNKVSAITAIHGGYTGERFQEKKGLRLSKTKLSVPFYLGINDILSHITRYTVLIITFCISFILITIPLNTLNTMKSDEMIEKFYIDPESSVCVRKIEQAQDKKYANSQELLSGIKRVQEEMKEKGYSAEMTAVSISFMNYNIPGSSEKSSIMTLQLLGKERNFSQYEEGNAPMLENEIAFSKTIMKEHHWSIGDFVQATINGQEKSFIISGIYSDYMQLGKSARINPKINCSEETMTDYWAVMVDLEINKSQKELADLMQKEFPNYEWVTTQQLVDQNVGGIQEILSELVIPMTGMLCAIIMLITLLMEKLFITREKGEIAMMKSIGFSQKTIRYWQLMRMSVVVLTSMIISIPLSLLSNHFILKPIFAIMGADVTIQVNPLQVYLVYPGVLLIGILVATIIATSQVKKINIREMNNLE